MLPWYVVLDDEVVAVFRAERDARGFSAARFKGDAMVTSEPWAVLDDTDERRVLRAVIDGAEHSTDVAGATGLDIHKASAYLYFLWTKGLIERTGIQSARGVKGRRHRLYAVTERGLMEIGKAADAVATPTEAATHDPSRKKAS